MKQNPDALAWFTKPEKAMKHRINDYVNKKHQDHLKLIEQVKSVRDMVNASMVQVEEGLCSMLDVLDTKSSSQVNEASAEQIVEEAPGIVEELSPIKVMQQHEKDEAILKKKHVAQSHVVIGNPAPTTPEIKLKANLHPYHKQKTDKDLQKDVNGERHSKQIALGNRIFLEARSDIEFPANSPTHLTISKAKEKALEYK